MFRRAVVITEATYEPNGAPMVVAYNNLAETLIDVGDFAGALAAFGKSERASDGAQIDPRSRVCILMGKGLALVELGRLKEGVPVADGP